MNNETPKTEIASQVSQNEIIVSENISPDKDNDSKNPFLRLKSIPKIRLVGSIICLLIIICGIYTIINPFIPLNDNQKEKILSIRKQIDTIEPSDENIAIDVIYARQLEITKKDYDELSADEKALVKNSHTLEVKINDFEVAKAKELNETIKSNNSLAAKDLDTWLSYRKSYEEISDKNKSVVTECDKIELSIETIKNQIAAECVKAIDNLPNFTNADNATSENYKKIENINVSLSKLEDEEKSKVTNYDKLKQASTNFISSEEKLVANIIKQIDNLPDFTDEDNIDKEKKKTLDDIKSKYNSLREEAQKRVTNYSKLTKAENDYTSTVAKVAADKLVEELKEKQKNYIDGNGWAYVVEEAQSSWKYNTFHIKGIIRNDSGQNARYASLSFNIYDSNKNLIGSAYDNVSNWRNGTTWAYDATFYAGSYSGKIYYETRPSSFDAYK